MSTLTPTVIRECPNCGHSVVLGATACPECHTLIYGADLNALARDAKALEARGDYAQAREMWNRSLPLLPPDSKQAEWVRDHVRALEIAHAELEQAAARPAHPMARKLGPLAPIAIVLAKSKGLLLAIFKLKFLFSFFWFIVIYAGLFGWRFGLGIAVSVLVHEMGHYIDIKRRGLPAEMPVFLPGLGAYVRWAALGVTARTRAFVSLAGPLAGCFGAAVCALLWMRTGDSLWIGLATASALLNVLNLIPVWVLDGGQAIKALNKAERIVLACAAVALAAGLGQPALLLVAAGAAYRVFTKDVPAAPNRAVMVYYLLVLAALGFVMGLAPPLPVHS